LCGPSDAEKKNPRHLAGFVVFSFHTKP